MVREKSQVRIHKGSVPVFKYYKAVRVPPIRGKLYRYTYVQCVMKAYRSTILSFWKRNRKKWDEVFEPLSQEKEKKWNEMDV